MLLDRKGVGASAFCAIECIDVHPARPCLVALAIQARHHIPASWKDSPCRGALRVGRLELREGNRLRNLPQ